ncbi:hypothetical protein DICSQDRAFT_125120 [Dichomitus squalens LYAD-421 SS1]|uniref:uncharacterized protein n=1 Tax=Dichomitus squalens (strain LYAD-421) TaxID=732165 RepID=UPI0004415F91|nr:uncharacterized protein DICSQDRAFT_125120 [Dichomitus squalens LYAD-421 SS1]EJF64023.1 hypothetical protein DICSQDRAFT_125120 [Dichomitus squalens LYAD-421 SS1]
MSTYPVYVVQQYDSALPSDHRRRLSIVVQTHHDRKGEPIGDIYCAEGSIACGFQFKIYRDQAIRKMYGYCGRVCVGQVDSHGDRGVLAFEYQLGRVDTRDGMNWAYYALRRLFAQGFRIDVWAPEGLRPMLDEAFAASVGNRRA